MSLFTRSSPIVRYRGIHFDLKGVPPTPARHLELLRLMHSARLNVALVEWEDTYPWTAFPELRNETAYSEAHVRRFLAQAAELGIQVIPLTQCFGHMENLLLKKRFCRLREVPNDPRDLCPLKPGSRRVLLAMIDDVLRTHAGAITHYHLGGDEAATLGSCPACRRFARRHGKAALYLKHVRPLLEHLGERGIRPILWDDMMRGWSITELKALAPMADLMAWSYGNDPFVWLKRETLDRYAAAGVTLWGASCFKGGDGITADVTLVDNRAANMLAWAQEARRRPLAGIVATGWSRYSVCVVPCETIEVGLDALVLAGATAWDGRLPRNPVQAARKFLKRKVCATVAGRFETCLTASAALGEWRKQAAASWTILHAEALCSVSGEPERRNDRECAEVKDGMNALLREGERLGREFIRAHRGLVPAIWLERYVASRLQPFRDRLAGYRL